MSLKVPKRTTSPALRRGTQGLFPIPTACAYIRPTHLSASVGPADAILRNIQAVTELSDLVGTSFWAQWCVASVLLRIGCVVMFFPGRNRLVVKRLGRLFVTSDAATTIWEIEVVHPAAVLLVMASQAQESEASLFTGHEGIWFVRVAVVWLCTALPQPSRFMTARPNLVALGSANTKHTCGARGCSLFGCGVGSHGADG